MNTNDTTNAPKTKLPNYRIYDRTGGGVTHDIYAESLEDAIEQGRDWIEDGEWSGGDDEDGNKVYRTIELDCCVREIDRECYYVDVYRDGCARDIRGPFTTIEDAREITSGNTPEGEELSIDPYDGVLEDLAERHDGATVEMVEAWSADCESDADTIYRVTGHDIDGDIDEESTDDGQEWDCSGEYSDELPECEATEAPSEGTDSEGHDWRSDYEVVGGIKENPGVWSGGGTRMSFRECCALCGCYKNTTRPGVQRNPGEPIETITIEPRDEKSEAWLKEIHADEDGKLPEWLAEMLGVEQEDAQ